MDRPAPTGASLLHHDSTPVDPLSLPKRHSNFYYEPSTGVPTRSFGKKTHGSQGPDGQAIFLDKPTRNQYQEERARRVSPQPRRTRPEGDPGHAAHANEFLLGKHTTPAARSSAGGIKMMFDDPARLVEKAEQARRLDKAVSDDNYRTAQQRRQQRHHPDPMVMPDVWEDRKPVVDMDQRRPRRNYVATGKVFNDGSEDAYAAKAFGRQGCGAPIRDEQGRAIVKKREGFSTYRTHNEGPDDAYVAQHFGKPGAGNPLRDDDGRVVTKLGNNVGSHAIHHRGSVGGDFSFNAVGPGGAPVRSGSGTVHAHRRGDIVHNRHHVEGPPDPFLDRAFHSHQSHDPAHRHDLSKELTKAHNSGPPIYLDRHAELRSKDNVPPRPQRITQDEEFSVQFRGRRNNHIGTAVYHNK